MKSFPNRSFEARTSACGLEDLLSPAAGRAAFEKVRANRGAPGIDGVTTEELAPVFDSQWAAVGEAIRLGLYRPVPLRRVEIPKASGGSRKLGIPAVIDRVVQQSIAMAVGPIFEPMFSDRSYAYRPGRATHDAVFAVQRLLAADPELSAVQLDIRAYFDEIDHEMLLGHLREAGVGDSVVSLASDVIRCPVREGIVVRANPKGVPQGSPLSPLLANVYLHPFDRWLERRSVAFARYADDILILVPGLANGRKWIDEIDELLRSELRLELNRDKTRISAWTRISFLGFGFRRDTSGHPRRRVSEEASEACKAELDRIVSSVGPDSGLAEEKCGKFLAGWISHFRHTEFGDDILSVYCAARDGVRRVLWQEWRDSERRRRELVLRGIGAPEAETAARQEAPPLAVLRRAVPDVTFHGRSLADPFPGFAPSQSRSEPSFADRGDRFSSQGGAANAARPGYDGSIPRRNRRSPIDWFSSARWFLQRMARSRLFRLRLESTRSRGGWWPRPTAIILEVGGFGLRIRL